jgi:sarcosine/dimethylglycine N-methyltransferase
MAPPNPSTETIAAQVAPEIYGRSGDISKHLEGVKAQYDTENKIEFYKQVMGDGTANIHFGKWDNIDLDQEGAYGKASEQMTDYMFDLVSKLCDTEGDFKYVDLGSGTGAAALRLVKMHPHITHATCLNLCDEQNALATKAAADAGLASRIKVVTGTYDEAPFEENQFDACFSQDAFVHAFSKKHTFSEAFRITKPGGSFVWCDLMCGAGEGVSDEELQTFAATNMVNDWLSPEENVAACQAVGWEDVKFVDLTSDIRISFQLMLKKVEKIIADGNPAGIDEKLLASYKTNLANRMTQVDRGVFKWGVIHCKKPAAN